MLSIVLLQLFGFSVSTVARPQRQFQALLRKAKVRWESSTVVVIVCTDQYVPAYIYIYIYICNHVQNRIAMVSLGSLLIEYIHSYDELIYYIIMYKCFSYPKQTCTGCSKLSVPVYWSRILYLESHIINFLY